jgi:hypothetical protein
VIQRICAESGVDPKLKRRAPTVSFEEGLERTVDWYRQMETPVGSVR